MQEMCRQKLLYCAQNIENQRMTNVGTELERLIAMLLQLSNLTCVDESLGLAEEALQKLQVASQNETDSTRRVPDTSYGTVGRPKYIIPFETLDMLLESGLKVNDIANMFNVSKRTIERRMHECQLSVGQTYSTITDEQLETEVNNLCTLYPNVGYRTIKGMLFSKGHRVQELRVRQAVQQCDPCGVLYRKLFMSTNRIQRRTYSVSGPQALWHIDGNHKLIRYVRFLDRGLKFAKGNYDL